MNKLIVLQHLEIEGPGLFSRISKQKGIKVEIIRVDLEEDIPSNLETGDILLILGGPMGVKDIGNDLYPWLEKEVKLIKSILYKNIGIIGVCLGAQLLAYAAGGDVEILKSGYPLKPTPEIGWSEISSTLYDSNDEISCFLKKPMKVLHWHADRIILPPNIKLLASSKQCKEQLFKLRNKAYGIQFHVESDENMIYEWIKTYEEFVVSALGVNGPEILIEQENIMGNQTLNRRISFISKLIEITK